MIQPGARIAAVAPSGAFRPELLESGLTIARAAGFDVAPIGPFPAPLRYLAGDDHARRDALVTALSDPAYDAVWLVRGGYGLTRILAALPPDLPERPIIGFSDATALFCARPTWAHVHGPMLHSLAASDADSQRALFDLLRGASPEAPWRGDGIVGGRAQAPVVGGNLCLLAALCGTRHQLDARGRILMLEEVGEPAYKLDRLLQQIRSAGVLDGVAAVAVGELHDCHLPPGVTWTHNDVLMDHLGGLGVPVVTGLPFGHGARNHPFVWGHHATLDGDAGTLTHHGAAPPLA